MFAVCESVRKRLKTTSSRHTDTNARSRHTDTYTRTHTHAHAHKHTQTHRHIDRQTYLHTDTPTHTVCSTLGVGESLWTLVSRNPSLTHPHTQGCPGAGRGHDAVGAAPPLLRQVQVGRRPRHGPHSRTHTHVCTLHRHTHAHAHTERRERQILLFIGYY